ncbi:TPA: recombinase family protein [Vibrio parahaemolyticus]|nr:recombinase family protein [Vibrio parahaemolyticus]HCH1657837.1 recombinase family protein [Vibrio parahaemolyticus]HCH1661204.1 recombinase family protein [Vibrio parahaemolyticus]
MKAYLYIRFSSKQQEQGDSVRRQEEAARKWCKTHDVELSDMTFEDLGVSAFKEGGKRPALADLIEAIELGKIARDSYVLVENDDRLSRHGWYATQQMIRRMVLDLGVKLVVISSGTVYDSSNIEDIAQNILLMFNADRAHKESLRKSEMIRAARQTRRDDETLTGKLPFWLKRVDDKILLDQQKADIVRMIVELKKSGKSNQATARFLNDQKINSATGGKWNASAIRMVCSNHAIYGAKAYFITDGTRKMTLDKVVEDKLPAIVTKADFDAVQTTQKHRGRRSTKTPFSLLLKCGKCGGGMVQRTSMYKEKKMIYRRCIASLEGRCDQNKLIREPDVILSNALKHMQYIDSVEQYVSRVSSIQAQIDTLKQTQDRLIELGQVDALTNLYTRLAELEQKLVQARIEDEANEQKPIDFNYKNVFDLEDASEQNAMLKRVIDSIEIHYLGVVDKKTSSKWRIKVNQRNKHHQGFVINQYHGFGNWEIIHMTDTEKFKKELEALTDDIDDCIDFDD